VLLLAACGSGATHAAEGSNTAAGAQSPSQRDFVFPALTGRVVDQADLLNAAQEQQLVRTSQALERRTTDQLVIVTVPSLQGRAIEDYSRALGSHWGIGQREKDNGVLLVVAPNERLVRIAVGYGLEPILTNARASEIIDRDLLPAFRESRWNDGISAATQSIVSVLVAHEREPRRGRR
jgi:uncharacterized protein